MSLQEEGLKELLGSLVPITYFDFCLWFLNLGEDYSVCENSESCINCDINVCWPVENTSTKSFLKRNEQYVSNMLGESQH